MDSFDDAVHFDAVPDVDALKGRKRKRKARIMPDGEGTIPATNDTLIFAQRLLASYHARDVARALLAASMVFYQAAERVHGK